MRHGGGSADGNRPPVSRVTPPHTGSYRNADPVCDATTTITLIVNRGVTPMPSHASVGLAGGYEANLPSIDRTSRTGVCSGWSRSSIRKPLPSLRGVSGGFGVPLEWLRLRTRWSTTVARSSASFEPFSGTQFFSEPHSLVSQTPTRSILRNSIFTRRTARPRFRLDRYT